MPLPYKTAEAITLAVISVLLRQQVIPEGIPQAVNEKDAMKNTSEKSLVNHLKKATP